VILVVYPNNYLPLVAGATVLREASMVGRMGDEGGVGSLLMKMKIETGEREEKQNTTTFELTYAESVSIVRDFNCRSTALPHKRFL